MLDIKFIREHIDEIKQNCLNRNLKCDLDRLLELDEQRLSLLHKIEDLKAQKNNLNIEVQKAANAEKQAVIERGKLVKEELSRLEPEFLEIEKEYTEILLKVPNVYSEDTPIGKDENENQVIRQMGKVPTFDFAPKEHWELGKALDVIDLERAAKVTGSRFYYLKGALPMLEMAIIQHVFATVTDEEILGKIIRDNNLNISAKAFVPVLPPVFIKPEVMQRMARLEPREERYHTEADDLYLIGSAEHTLGSMHMDETFKEEELPIRYMGFSTSFRREAGSYGKDMKGILRVHQFDKLEMESFALAENGLAEQNLFIAIQEYLLQSLNLPYQVMQICTGDMGNPDYRQIDMETWLPGQGKYRETHTSDYMTDYQSRRLNIRVKRKDAATEFVYMNDATAFAIGRIMIAIMENYQQADGSILIPEVLKKYMAGKEKISK